MANGQWLKANCGALRPRNSINGAKRQAPFTEPTPNREQSVLAPFAEVRRRKTKGQWQSLPMVAEWQRMAKWVIYGFDGTNKTNETNE